MMPDEISPPAALSPLELEAVYAISRAVARATNTEAALDEIIQAARPVFIFDNIVLYEQGEASPLEPAHARAIGRGRYRSESLVWGETIANDSFQSAQTILRVERADGDPTDRLSIRYMLALPLHLGNQVKGVLVFIRFGGPDYTPEQIHLAEFISILISQLLERRQLVDRIANLEARRRLEDFQEDFIAMISHELLTPLGFIKGYATTLLREDITWDEETRHEFLAIIDEEADRLRELIDHLMDSNRLQSGDLQMNFQPIRLDTLVRDISLRAKTMYENLNIQLKINTKGMQVQADPTRLAQVFDNLIGNAIKYAPGSPVIITLDRVEQRARIGIRDYGAGISPDHLKNLFTRFYRIPTNSSAVRGTGLGLYICRKIIQAHHGDIEVESKLNEGTTFYIYLPCES